MSSKSLIDASLCGIRARMMRRSWMVPPFALVMSGGLESRLATAALVIGLAVVQILVHMVCFLHMSAKSEAGWTLLSTLFTVIVVVIMLAGSLWVMYHMNANMMPMMEH